jgi:hypothetical protein
MQENDKLQICIPTGAGKGYIMMTDLINRLLSSDEEIFVISSHRLMLNTQHLNDIFNDLSTFLGEIGFIFVGSSKYDTSKFNDNQEFNKKLLKKKLSYTEIITSTTSKKEVKSEIKRHLNEDRKVVILTTYHSLSVLGGIEIDTIYNDEAHTLASEELSQFQKNYEVIEATNTFFFTATPKDCHDKDTDYFLMNNKDVFGERIGLTFKECVDKGYVVRPTVHIAVPSNFSSEYDYNSIQNMSKFVEETYLAHQKFITEHSSDPEQIVAKILIKCPSVDHMWKIHKELVNKMGDILVCAGASKNDDGNYCHYIGNDGIKDRSEYLVKLQKLSPNQKAIILHYDTMSEGINLSGFTGVEFLGGKLPTITKVLQNTGRATRLHPIDRNKLVSGEIGLDNISGWIKPYCSVIIPYWDRESELSKVELAKQIKGLRDQFGFDPTYYVSVGTDIGKGKKEDEMDALNNRDKKDKKAQIIEEINHEIEVLDKEEMDQKERDKVNELDFMGWLNYNNPNNKL